MTFNKYRLKGAFHYDWYETEDWYKWLVDRCVDFCKDGAVIDIGCGDGLLCSKLLQNGYLVEGIDPDPHAIEIAREKAPGCLFTQIGLPSSFSSNTDYLTCLNVVEHLRKPERLLNVIRTNINKGAIITTIDYQGGTLGEDHKFEWTYDEMMDFFKEFKPKGFRYKDTEWIGVEIRI